MKNENTLTCNTIREIYKGLKRYKEFNTFIKKYRPLKPNIHISKYYPIGNSPYRSRLDLNGVCLYNHTQRFASYIVPIAQMIQTLKAKCIADYELKKRIINNCAFLYLEENKIKLKHNQYFYAALFGFIFLTIATITTIALLSTIIPNGMLIVIMSFYTILSFVALQTIDF